MRNLGCAYIMVNSDVAESQWARGEGQTSDTHNQQQSCLSIYLEDVKHGWLRPD